MIDDESSPLLPRYCMICGAPLNYSEISSAAGEGKASYKCTGCGNEDTDRWSEMSFLPLDDQTSQSLPDVTFPPQLPDDLLPPPPPPPPLPPLLDDSEIFDFSVVETSRELNEEHREHQRQYEALERQINADGVVAIVRAAHFPLFALTDLQERFPYQSFGWGSGWAQGRTPRPLLSFDLSYAGAGYPDSTERIRIEQRDKEGSPELHYITDDLQGFGAERLVRFLAGLVGPEEPELRKLWDGMAIYQYINLNTVRKSTTISSQIRLQKAELVTWKIRQFHAPLAIAYGQAEIQNTMIEVGAIGSAAKEIENILGQLTRLTPDNEALMQLDAGIKRMEEYFQNYYRSL